jgi:flagella basal body P-ring formation protein FlgA
VLRLLTILIILIAQHRVYAGYFDNTLKDLISEKLGTQLSYEIKFDSNSKYQKILSQENELKSISLNFFSPETRSFKVMVTMPDDTKTEIFGKYEAFFEVVVSARLIKYGEEITPGDIKIIKVKKLKSGESALKDLSKIYGMEAKSNILPGQVIRVSDLKNPSIIKENDPVTLLYTAKDVSLKTLGIAQSGGAIGDKIKVKNEKTNIIVFGEIIDKNIVKVSSTDEK